MSGVFGGIPRFLRALAALGIGTDLLEQTGAAAFARRTIGVGTSSSIPTRADADARYALLGSSPPQLALADIPTILATSPNGDYERHPERPSVIRMKPKTWADVADAIATPPSNWTWVNSGNFASIAIVNGRMRQVSTAAGVAKDYNNGTSTSGHGYRALGTHPTGVWERTYRLDAETLQASHAIRWSAGTTINGQTSVQVDLYNNAGTYQLRCATLNSGAWVVLSTVTAGQLAAGVWVRVTVSGSSFQIDYDLTTGGTDSDACTWTYGKTDVMSISTVSSLIHTTNTQWYEIFSQTLSAVAVASTTGVVLGTERLLGSSSKSTYVAKNSRGMATTGDTLTLLTYTFGVATVLDIDALRLRLADMVNRLPGDAGTWLFGATGSNSDPTPEAPVTMQPAASLDLKADGSEGTGDDAADPLGYTTWSIFARCSSAGGAQQGSIDTSLGRVAA